MNREFYLTISLILTEEDGENVDLDELSKNLNTKYFDDLISLQKFLVNYFKYKMDVNIVEVECEE